MTAAVTAIAPARPLPPPKLRLRAEIAWTTVRVRRLLRRNDLSATLGRCRAATGQGAPAPSRDEVVRVSRAVRRTLGALPGDSRGLIASLVLIAVLARRGVASSLVVGRPRHGYGAHAWVEVGGLPALPAAKDKFAQLVAL
ncbi:MAG TPA: lasso peptide biosynthesis B2 protein [Acidimicrobiia bacterium]|nr:lasso peptide biosynthesis B2 protein [Acidimicrobiia bacterium]